MNDWLSSAQFLRTEASRYDEQIGAVWPTDPTVRFLRELIGCRARVLEFGIGTGRVALPLAHESDLVVTGVDNSPEMLGILARKDPAGRVRALQADMVDVVLAERFDLIYCVFNTIYALPNQGAQIDLLCNAARHLADGGRVVMETQMIGLSEFVNNKIVAPVLIQPDRTELVMIIHDPASQTIVRQTMNFRPDGVHLAPLRMRYVWPAELDLMARIAGLRLADRFGGWAGEAFTGTGVCVSVYEQDVRERDRNATVGGSDTYDPTPDGGLEA